MPLLVLSHRITIFYLPDSIDNVTSGRPSFRLAQAIKVLSFLLKRFKPSSVPIHRLPWRSSGWVCGLLRAILVTDIINVTGWIIFFLLANSNHCLYQSTRFTFYLQKMIEQPLPLMVFCYRPLCLKRENVLFSVVYIYATGKCTNQILPVWSFISDPVRWLQRLHVYATFFEREVM